MKLKEYPVSLFHSARLLLTPKHKLGNQGTGAKIPITVSLTSIASRLPILHLTIRSLLNQSVRPERLILWLHHDLKPMVPPRLNALQSLGFEIRYADQTSAHRKLVHTLASFPDATIVTCDDDLLYRPDWLESLYNEHRQYPNDVVANECRRIAYDNRGKPLPYKYWQAEPKGASHPDTLAIGYGGTLYPAGSLHPDVTQAELYSQLAPKADDLWFKAMTKRNNVSTRRNAHPPDRPIPIIRSQTEALGKTNIKQDGNRVQWDALREYYQFKTPEPE